MSVPTSSFTHIDWDTISYDVGSDCSLATNKFTAPYDGIYFIDVAFRTEQTTGVYRNIIAVEVNGSEALRLYDNQTGGNGTGIQIGGTGQLNLTAGDYVEVAFWQNIGSTRSYSASTAYQYYHFAGHLVART